MTYTRRLFLPFRAYFVGFSHSNSLLFYPRNTVQGKYERLKLLVKSFQPVLRDRAVRFRYGLISQRRLIQTLCFSGIKLSMGCMYVQGSFYLWPCIAYAMDGKENTFAGTLYLTPFPVIYLKHLYAYWSPYREVSPRGGFFWVNLNCVGTVVLAEEDNKNLTSAPGFSEDDLYSYWAMARKLWLPSFLVITILTSWGHPIALTVKVILFLLSTNPSPFSVYLFVEQLRHQSMREAVYVFKIMQWSWVFKLPAACQSLVNYLRTKFDNMPSIMQPVYAKKVDVEDYKLFCLARVEMRDQKITLLGILGSWWVLQSSPAREEYFALGSTALKN